MAEGQGIGAPTGCSGDHIPETHDRICPTLSLAKSPTSLQVAPAVTACVGFKY